MEKIIECVPNFSEGKDQKIIDLVCKAAKDAGATVLSLAPDADYNRTVLTFVGDPETVKEAAFAVIKTCYELIDMTAHKGGHPRLGACDVTPFIPVAGVTMDDCADVARALGKLVAEKLDLPVYLYGRAAAEGKQDLAKVRKGQYEGLPDKLKDPQWQPDFGSPVFVPSFGAPLIGARPFLIAYNVNLDKPDVDAANDIAKAIRTSGRKVDRVKVPGTLQAVKGLGVLLKEKNIAQVSMNLTDYSVTNMHQAFEEVKKFAEQKGLKVTGSEICGIVPADAIVQSGRYYAGAEADMEHAIKAAVDNLGLDDLEPFVAEKMILDIMLKTSEPETDCSC